MNNQQKNDVSIYNIKGISTTAKLKEFFKQKMALILLIIGSLAFIFKDAIKWSIADDDILVLLSSMAITFFFSFYVILIMGKMGMKSGKNSEVFKSTMNYYSKAKSDIEPLRKHLRDYCVFKTKQEKELIQDEILTEENLFLDKLQEYKEEDLTKKEWKAVKKARSLKVVKLIDKDLISERGKGRKSRFSTYLGKTERDFTKENELINFLTRGIIPIIIAYVSVESIVFENVLSGVIKVVIILFGGLINYMTNEDFAINDLRNRFINKADSLIEFKTMVEDGFFNNKEEVKENNEIIENEIDIIELTEQKEGD